MAEKEYIERSELIRYAEVELRMQGDLFRRVVESCPTADVVEVKHGEWVDNGIQDSMLSECSLCGFPCGAYTFNYCPNCGAKMDGKRRNT